MEILIIFVGLALDRISKYWAAHYLSKINEIVISKDFFSLYYLQNRGAAFGIFQNKLIFLALITSIILISMIYYLIKYKPKSLLLRVALSLIICGALGNLYDRIIYKHVVDFILFHYKTVYSFAVFNAADIFVTFGTILLGLYLLKN